MRTLVFVAFFIMCACHDNCTPEATRCHGDSIQICNSEKDWELAEDCTLVNPGLWECCEDYFMYENELLPACVPLDTCEQDSGGVGGDE